MPKKEKERINKKNKASEKKLKAVPLPMPDRKPKKRRPHQSGLTSLDSKDILELQHTIGNRAVGKLIKGLAAALTGHIMSHAPEEDEFGATEESGVARELIVSKKNEIERIFYELGNNIVQLDNESAQALEIWLISYSGDNGAIRAYASYYEVKGKSITGTKERIWRGLKYLKKGKNSLEDLASLREAYQLINLQARNKKGTKEAAQLRSDADSYVGLITDEPTEKEFLISRYAEKKPDYQKVGVIKPDIRAKLYRAVARLLEKAEDGAWREIPAPSGDNQFMPALSKGVDEMRYIMARGDGKDIGELGLSGFIYLALHLDRPEQTGFDGHAAALRQLKFMLE